jgi:hypothetical protein
VFGQRADGGELAGDPFGCLGRRSSRRVAAPGRWEVVDLASLRADPELTVGKDLSLRHCDMLYSATIGDAPGYV